MAGKEGAAGKLGRTALKLAQLVDRYADVLVALPAPEDGPAVEKAAKQVKAVADAGRSVVALEVVADKAVSARDAAPSARSPDAPFDAEDEMDMDDDEFAALDPDAVARRCEDFVARAGRLVGQLECKGLDRRAGAHRQAGVLDPPAVRAERGAGPA